MRDKFDFKSCFKLFYEIANNPVLNYKCEFNKAGCIIEVPRETQTINGLSDNEFLREIDDDLKTGMTILKDKLKDISQEDANKLIHEFLREKKNCESLIYSDIIVIGIHYRYFSKGKYHNIESQKDNNLSPRKEIRLSELGDSFQLDSPIESSNRTFIRASFSPFCDLYIDKLTSLEFELGTLNALIRIPESKKRKYELTIGKKYSSKELVYLINVLTRIDFFVIGPNDHAKLHHLIADLYRSPRDEDANKFSNVKKCWDNSDGDRITKEFCKKFDDEVIGRMKLIVDDDKNIGYNPSREIKKI